MDLLSGNQRNNFEPTQANFSKLFLEYYFSLPKNLLAEKMSATYFEAQDTQSVYQSFWSNKLTKTSLRLSHWGFHFCKNYLDLEVYQHSFPMELHSSKNILTVERVLTTPYYINHTVIHLFDQEIDTLVTLYGDVQTYIMSNS
jgi:hypothetical protein